jgi:nuclear transport factor 2 (NTF2) superfamily protein
MERTIQIPTPPWDMDKAAERLKFEEEAWNTRDPERISEGYADNIEMRDGIAFINGKSELKSFLVKKVAEHTHFRLKLDLWGALKARMAVRFEAEWKDQFGQWVHAYGVQVLQFNESGQIEQRFASQEVITVLTNERKLS